MEPLVSILMTAFNRQKYIADAIESVLASTYANWELIIVDDGSTDETLSIAKRYVDKDSRIKLFVNEKNLGQFANRNKAASYALGEYIKYLDSDDMIYPDSLRKMVAAMQLFPQAVWGTERVPNSLALSAYKNISLPVSLNTIEAYTTHYKGGGLLFTGPTATIFKKSAFSSIGGFSLDLGIDADVDLNLKMAANGDCVIIADDLTFWRRHDEQIDTQQSNKLKMLKEKYIINYINLTHLSLPLSTSLRKEIIIIQKILYARNLFKFIIQFRKPAAIFTHTGKDTLRLYELMWAIVPVRWAKYF